MTSRKPKSDPNAARRARRIAELSKEKSTDRSGSFGRKKGHCRFCDGPVPKGRRTFCSESCVHELSIRSIPAYARARVFDRDGGVCSQCKLDVSRLERIMERSFRIARARWNGKRFGERSIYFEARARVARLLKLGEIGQLATGKSLWEMDHVVPVAEGGGMCGLDNLRTLCSWCHLHETRLLARRLARARSSQAALFEPVVLDADIEHRSRKAERGRSSPSPTRDTAQQASLFEGTFTEHIQPGKKQTPWKL